MAGSVFTFILMHLALNEPGEHLSRSSSCAQTFERFFFCVCVCAVVQKCVCVCVCVRPRASVSISMPMSVHS